MKRLVLGSSSPYRKALLERLQLPFEIAHPDIDESPLPGEAPLDLVARLALEKAQAVAAQYPDTLVIGCDQLAVLEDRVLGKPGGFEQAVKQLHMVSGKTVRFLSALCLFNSETRQYQLDVVPFDVQFKPLTRQQIESYLNKDQPYACAGSIKSESLGIVLFEKMHGDDPNALLGLPLIRLVAMLETEGVNLL